MKILPLAILTLATIGASAEAAPQLRGATVAEQIANGPAATGQNEDKNKNATAPNTSSSKKLSESKGVIHPPLTHDRNVVKPPGNTTGEAVIAPPGTTGGDQSIQPK